MNLNRWKAVGLIALSGCLLTVTSTHAQQTPPPGKPAVECKCPPLFQNLPPLGADTPQALLKKFMLGLVTGNQADVISCFDLQSVDSVATALLSAKKAEETTITEQLNETIRKRFGEKGVAALRDQLGYDLSKIPQGVHLRKEVEEEIPKMEIVTQGDTSVAHAPNARANSWMKMRRVNGRWYMLPPEQEAGSALTGLAFDVGFGLAQQMKRIQTAAEQCSTVQEFEQKLEKMKKEMKPAAKSPPAKTPPKTP
jgi:hypothetical protein